MRIQPTDIIDADMVLKLFPSLSALLKEVRTEPDLLQMGFMWILGEYLLDRYFPL